MDVRYHLISAGCNYSPGNQVLSFAEKDAEDIYKVFVGEEGPVPPQNATLLTGASANAEAIILSLAHAHMNKPTHFLFFFSGHGNEEGFALFDGLFLFSTLAEWVRGIDASYTVVILDTCRAAAFARHYQTEGQVRVGGVPSFSWYEALAAANEGTRLIFSTAANRNSGESSVLQGGAFTQSFIKALREAKPDISLSDGTVFVSDQRAFNFSRWYMHHNLKLTAQIPQEMGIMGDFPLSRPDGSNLIGDGWIRRISILPSYLRVFLHLQGRTFVPTTLRYSILNAQNNQLHEGVIAIEPAAYDVQDWLDIRYDPQWLKRDALSSYQKRIYGRSKLYWRLSLENAAADELDSKIVATLY